MVIAIIGILAALVVANFNAARERARDAQRKSDLDQIKKALRMYYNDQDPRMVYPPTGSLPFDNVFQSASSLVYMKRVPNDPQHTSDPGSPAYTYQMTDPNSQDFCLWAELENRADSDIDKSQARCTNCGGLDPNEDYVVCAD